MTSQRGKIAMHTLAQKHIDDIAGFIPGIGANCLEVRRRPQQSLTNQKTHRQFVVMTRSPQGHAHTASIDPNFQWLLGGNGIH